MADSWQRQLRRAARSLDELRARFLPGLEITPGMRQAERRFPTAGAEHSASPVERPDFSDPVFRQCVPSGEELVPAPWASRDPLAEEPCSPLPRLVRRYPDRAVLLACDACACRCRHCFRKRVSARGGPAVSDAELAAVARWLRANPRVEDVLVSGGDPLVLPDARVAAILGALRSVPTVRVVRIATRLPATLPARFTRGLVRILAAARRGGGPAVFVSSHFNHPRELAPEAVEACARLVDSGIPVQNQAVLLRGVNDDPATMEALCRALYRIRVRPYYLFQADLAEGIEHLRTPLETGLRIMARLRANLSGPAIPNFCLDPPGHAGKIELAPATVARRVRGATEVRAADGTPFRYPDPRTGA